MSYIINSPIDAEGTGVAPGQINFSDGTNAVQMRAPTGLAGNTNFVLPATDGTDGQVLIWNSSNATEWVSGSAFFPGQTLPIILNFSNPTNGQPATTSDTSFVPYATFIYKGTNADKPLSEVQFVVETDGASATGQCELTDITNANTIGTTAVFGPGPTSPTIVNLPSISNLPAGEALFEISIRRGNAMGGGRMSLYSTQLYG
jgi:hypothetical protein